MQQLVVTLEVGAAEILCALVDGLVQGLGIDLVRGGQGGRMRLGLPATPVVREHVVAFGLVLVDAVAQFGFDLVGVDAGHEGREFADGEAEGFLGAAIGRCHHFGDTFA